MYFMDNRALVLLGYWKEATNRSQAVHQFRTHSKEEDASFKRTLQRRGVRQLWQSITNGNKLKLIK